MRVSHSWLLMKVLAESFLLPVSSWAERDSGLSDLSYKETNLTLMTSFKPNSLPEALCPIPSH